MQLSIAILDSNGIDDVSGRENKHYYWNLSIDVTSNLKMIYKLRGRIAHNILSLQTQLPTIAVPVSFFELKKRNMFLYLIFNVVTIALPC